MFAGQYSVRSKRNKFKSVSAIEIHEILRCKQCPGGRYGKGGDTSAQCSGLCKPGRYGLVGEKTAMCTDACPAGRYGSSEGGPNDSWLCTGACHAGRFSSKGSTVCYACEFGMYQSRPAASSCLFCPKGQVSRDDTGYAGASRCDTKSHLRSLKKQQLAAKHRLQQLVPTPPPTPKPKPQIKNYQAIIDLTMDIYAVKSPTLFQHEREQQRVCSAVAKV